MYKFYSIHGPLTFASYLVIQCIQYLSFIHWIFWVWWYVTSLGHGQTTKNSFPSKFCSLPGWFSYDDDSCGLQKGRTQFCRFSFLHPNSTKTAVHILDYVFGVSWTACSQGCMIHIGHMHVMWMKWTGYWERSLLNSTKDQYWKMYAIFPLSSFNLTLAHQFFLVRM